MDEEAEEAYQSEADYYEEDEEYEDELEEEEEGEEEGELDVDYDAEIEEEKEPSAAPIVQKINELDENHRIVKIIPADKRQSSQIIQYFEMVEAIGIRISQIEKNAPVFTDVSGYTSAIMMAKKEFIDRKSPFILTRIMKTTDTEIEVEEWKVREMTIPISDRDILKITTNQINSILSSKHGITVKEKSKKKESK